MKIPVRCGALMCALLFKSTIALFAMKEPPAEARTPISAVPFTISEAGSYYLTGNLTASDSTSGITISADNVTLDLNGFALIGGGSGSVAGIVVPVAQKNLCIRNGTVRGWTNGGVRADTARNSRLENLRVSTTAATGTTELLVWSRGLVLVSKIALPRIIPLCLGSAPSMVARLWIALLREMALGESLGEITSR